MKKPRALTKPIVAPSLTSKTNLEPCGDAIVSLRDAAGKGELVVVIGSGVSMALTNGKIPALSWKGLIENGFSYGVMKGKITEGQNNTWKNQLQSNDLDELLGAAEFMARKLDGASGNLYARWLESVFKSVQSKNEEMESAINAMQAGGIRICTLNYDHLLESITGLPAINISDISKVTQWVRREYQGILHLHGSWDAPSTCILGIRDYETTIGNDVRDLIQRTLASFSQLLFIGCGETFSDPNFSALIMWLRENMKSAALQHYAFVSESEVAARHVDSTWQGFVEPISYGANHADLPAFLIKQFKLPSMVKKRKADTAALPTATPIHATLLNAYRSFLLKDCGQMTIEGVRADMDTAQRRFDLERLFVPLKVQQCPPEIPIHDPERENKLSDWLDKNGKSISFGKVFSRNKRLVLLALPGGGKTLLLKRLAVAYADPARRETSKDLLPDLDLTPVLIRCREWREYIRRPILTILQNIVEITGQVTLAGLGDALIPLLKKGKILLLIDGLDEIHDDADRTIFVDHLEVFLDEFKHTRLVVTSREAGFSLVAPSLARMCKLWRLAPLEEDAISSLCDHWHRLMTGDSPEALAEGYEVAQHLLENASLRRLAENPLLLTMLLVVKHGAGRLPPDRVSLYGRAVEVLLDTWNIKGHDALNLKEAVPQLACVAFQLTRSGKKTATERELLALLEEARDRVPKIQRYAKDTPHQFLKRVELRSSLLLEAGHQLENGRTVPFYQFRHLTFQEYLTAVAVVEGHYFEYEKTDSVLTPLLPNLTAEDWKEVIPMAAVLAGKQAEPLMLALVDEGNRLRTNVPLENDASTEKLIDIYQRLPPPIARLVQCLVEEAEASPETLSEALQLVAFFAKGCRSDDDWQALSRGPYGEELLHQVWLLYAPMQWAEESWVIGTFANLAAYCKPLAYWGNDEGQAEMRRLFSSQDPEEITRVLLTCIGLAFQDRRQSFLEIDILARHLGDIERHLFNDHPAVWSAACWAWALVYIHCDSASQASPATLDRLLQFWLNSASHLAGSWPALALYSQLGQPRGVWAPTLEHAQISLIRERLEAESNPDPKQRKRFAGYDLSAGYLAAFHSGDVFTEEELAKRLAALNDVLPKFEDGTSNQINSMLEQMGQVGQKYLTVKKLRRKKKILKNVVMSTS